MLRLLLLFTFVVAVGFSQTDATEEPDTYVFGDSEVTVPTVLIKRVPSYTDEAREAGIQGNVGLSIVVSENGKAENIKVVSPLGYGLDEKAIDAIQQWTFEPGKKDGRPVRVVSSVQVTFKLLNSPGFNVDRERQRFEYNLWASRIRDEIGRETAIQGMLKLAEEGFPPAMSNYSRLLESGQASPQQPNEALEWLVKAAEKDDVSAMIRAGRMFLKGDGVSLDFKKGKRFMEKVADAGIADAQYFLGSAYEQGTDGFKQDSGDAVDYYEQCASRTGLCQLGAGRTLLNKSNRRDRDYAEAIAWLQLAAEQDIAEAQQLLDQETANLTPDILEEVSKRRADLMKQ